jgi:hypothetical protein
MKTILFVLFVVFITAAVQPGVNVSFAQNNCTCAECGYPCKTPMVHESKCKYNNNKRTSEEKSNEVTSNKSVTVDDATVTSDTEFKMLLINSSVKSVSGDKAIDNSTKEKLLLEQKSSLEKLNPENDVQKLMYDDILKELQIQLNGLK